MFDYSQYIIIEPTKRFGKPTIKGTRISVYDVLNWLANEMTAAEILDDYPELKAEHIKACLSYAADRAHKLKVA